MAQTDLKQAPASTPTQSAASSSSSISHLQFMRSIAGLPYDEQVAALTPAAPVQYMVSDIAAADGSRTVQTSGGSAGPAAIRQAAAEGVHSGGGALPHLNTIQQSFGSHDVSSVSAHTGGAATRANQSMGALAYATGNHVAFKSSTPDLHTAAHEAAHVIQQRGGVSLSGGVGKVGDSYEKHADSVADAVVSGKSAAPLLDQAGPVQHKTDPSVQRKAVQMEGESTPGSGGDPAASTTQTPAPDPAALAANLPTAGYTEATGESHTISISVEGGQPAVMVASSPRPLVGQTDSNNPVMMAGEIERLTKEYVDTGNAALLAVIQTKMTELRAAMAQARGEDIPMVQLRTKFEELLGDYATAGSPGNFARGKTAIDTMCSNAIAMIGAYVDPTITAATEIDEVFARLSGNDTFKQAIEKTGKEVSTGYAGAVGLTFTDIQRAFTGGSLTEKCTHLINFGDTFLTENVLANHAGVMEQIRANLKTQEEYTSFLARVTAAKGVPKGQNKVLLTDNDRDPTGGFKNAKGSRDMDRKTAYEPIENLDDHELTWLAGNKNVNISGCRSRGDIIDALKAAGFTISGNAKGPVGAPSVGGGADSITATGVPYVQGIADNIVDPSHDWIKRANDLQMPLKAGISGTTHRFMNLAMLLGAGGSDARLAMLGHLEGIGAHSYHEICAAAVGFPNCEYVEGKYDPFSPITPQQMKTAAKVCLTADPAFATAVTGENDLNLQAERLLGLIP